MPQSEAQIKAKTKYEAKAYDKVLLRLKKGQRDIFASTAESQGKSLNAYIIEAIEEKIIREREA